METNFCTWMKSKQLVTVAKNKIVSIFNKTII